MTGLWIAVGAAAFVVIVLGGLGLVTGRLRRRGAAPSAPRRGRTPAGRARARPAGPTQRPPARPPVAEGAGTPVAGQPPAPPAPPRVGQPPAPGVGAPVEGGPAPRVGPTLRERLGKTRGIFAGLRSLRGRGVDPGTWDDLEETLLRADVGVATTDALLGDLRRRVAARQIGDGDQLLGALREELLGALDVERRRDAAAGPELADRAGAAVGLDGHPTGAGGRAGHDLRFDDEPGVVNVWLFVGVNGVGKTTTVGKVARQQALAGRSVLLAAGDTFRAAAGEQLAMWADRVGAEIVRGAEGGDPSAVVFDAVQRAAARGASLVLADTAGRLHTKVNLVEELKKIRRVADRPPGRVTEVLLVLDATTGQNGLVQARQFTDAVAVTGVALTKLDGTAKGGIVVAIQRELGLSVKLVGLGEGPDDLVPFDPAAFVEALLA